MKKTKGDIMKKFLKAMIALCLVVSCMFVLSACGEKTGDGTKNYANKVAGKYSNTSFFTASSVVSKKNITAIDIKEDGKFEFSITEISDVSKEATVIKGTMVFDENKNVVEVTFDNFAESFDNIEYYFGNKLPENEDYNDMPDMYNSLEKVYAALFENCFSFNDSYAVFCLGTEIKVMYKENAKKLADNSVLRVFTEKEYVEFGQILNMSKLNAKYEADYYFVKNEAFDISDQTIKSTFIEELEDVTYGIVTDYLGNGELDNLDITDIEGFDLTTVGTKIATIKYMDKTTEVSKQVSYKVVESKDDVPMNQIKEFELTKYGNRVSGLVYINQSESLYEKGYKLRYNTFGELSPKYIALTVENCTGDNKVVTVTGFDNAKTGYQVASFEYRGKTYKQAFFVFNESVDPIDQIRKPLDCKVQIDKTENTMTILNPTLTIEKKSGATETVTINKDWAINLNSLQNYEDGDWIIFEYNYTFDGQPYTYWFSINVVIK